MTTEAKTEEYVHVHYYVKNVDPMNGHISLSAPKLAHVKKDDFEKMAGEDTYVFAFAIQWPHADSCVCQECTIPVEIRFAKYWGPDSTYGMPSKFWTRMPPKPEDKKSENETARFSAIADMWDSEGALQNLVGHLDTSDWEIQHSCILPPQTTMDLTLKSTTAENGGESSQSIKIEEGGRLYIVGPKKS